MVTYSEIRSQMMSRAGMTRPESCTDRLGTQERFELLLVAIATNHSVTPSDGQMLGSSPDEVALVEFAAQSGLQLLSRSPHEVRLLRNGAERVYELLHTFPFTAATRRMGVVVRDAATGRAFAFVKGADTAIGPLLAGHHEWMGEWVGQFS